MAIHLKAFKEGLYLEHLEEAAFEYERRQTWLDDLEVGWQDLDSVDIAIEAHIDALQLGGALALRVCLDVLEDAEPSTLYIIVRVFCRHKLIDRLSALWLNFDFDDSEKTRAVSDALKIDCPDVWLSSLQAVFSSKRTQMYGVVAGAISTKTPNSLRILVEVLSSSSCKQLPVLIKAISSCHKFYDKKTIEQLSPFLDHEHYDVAFSAAKALCLAGVTANSPTNLDKIASYPCLLATLFDAKTCRALFFENLSFKEDKHYIAALGLNGSIQAVPILLNYLDSDDLTEVAAEALYWISGAPLYIDAYVEEDADEDILFEHEKQDFLKGVLPRNIDGKHYGEEVFKLSTDRETWFNWFSENKSLFKKDKRYRNGQLFSPEVLLNNLIDNRSSLMLREYAYIELVSRYGLQETVFVDGPVQEQQAILSEICSWVNAKSSTSVPGAWHAATRTLI